MGLCHLQEAQIPALARHLPYPYQICRGWYNASSGAPMYHFELFLSIDVSSPLRKMAGVHSGLYP